MNATEIKDGLEAIRETVENRVGKLEKDFENKQADFKRQLDHVTSTQNMAGLFGDSKTAGTVGQQVADAFAADFELFSKTKSVSLTVKAAADPITTAVAGRPMAGAIGVPSGLALGVQNAIPTREAPGTTSLIYSRYTSIEGAAAVQAGEGTAKAAVRPVFTEVTQQSITIAGFTKCSRQALQDREELVAAVDTTLRRSIAAAYDATWMTGSVTPAFSGLLALATPATSLVYNALVDATSEGVATMQELGFMPNVVAFRPADWLAIVTAKDTSGQYLSGDYLSALPENLRGLRVVLSPTVTAGKALLLDTGHIGGLTVSDFDVQVGYVDDDFTKNLVTLLGEIRIIPVFRAVGAARLITPMA